jgi:hypothetical protein
MVHSYSALPSFDVSKILDMSLSNLSTFSIFKALKVILFAILISVVWIILVVARDLLRPRFSALRALPIPEGGTFFMGHFGGMRNDWHARMIQKYGHVFRYKIGLGVSDRLTVLSHSSLVYTYASRNLLLYITNGSLRLLFTERNDVHHRHQSPELYPQQSHVSLNTSIQTKPWTIYWKRYVYRSYVFLHTTPIPISISAPWRSQASRFCPSSHRIRF